MATLHPGTHFVGSFSELLDKGRKHIKLNGKSIFVVHHRGAFFALDSFCYHAGGPLYQGDIEDISGIPCVVCPWHKYKITLETGEGLYHAIDPYNPQKPPQLKSKGVKQRSHKVEVKGDNIYVTITSAPKDSSSTIESDQYNNCKTDKCDSDRKC